MYWCVVCMFVVYLFVVFTYLSMYLVIYLVIYVFRIDLCVHRFVMFVCLIILAQNNVGKFSDTKRDAYFGCAVCKAHFFVSIKPFLVMIVLSLWTKYSTVILSVVYEITISRWTIRHGGRWLWWGCKLNMRWAYWFGVVRGIWLPHRALWDMM